MLSPWFWLGFGLVFVAVRWLSEGWLAAASLQVKRARPPAPAETLERPSSRPPGDAALDEAA